MENYDTVSLSESLSFFWAPMLVHLACGGIAAYEVGMSVQSLRHLPADTDVVLGAELKAAELKAAELKAAELEAAELEATSDAWVSSMLEECNASGRFANLQ